MISLSIDEPTKQFLLHLPQNVDVHDTTDFQGGNEEYGYFVTNVGNTPFHVFLKKDTTSFFSKVFPQWTLFKVSIAPNGQLPSILELLNQK
jgi:hypothetical protein